MSNKRTYYINSRNIDNDNYEKIMSTIHEVERDSLNEDKELDLTLVFFECFGGYAACSMDIIKALHKIGVNCNENGHKFTVKFVNTMQSGAAQILICCILDEFIEVDISALTFILIHSAASPAIERLLRDRSKLKSKILYTISNKERRRRRLEDLSEYAPFTSSLLFLNMYCLLTQCWFVTDLFTRFTPGTEEFLHQYFSERRDFCISKLDCDELIYNLKKEHVDSYYNLMSYMDDSDFNGSLIDHINEYFDPYVDRVNTAILNKYGNLLKYADKRFLPRRK